jgi:hypothetical protein
MINCLIKMWHWLLYDLNYMCGKALPEVDFDCLLKKKEFDALESHFIQCFEHYIPFEWEPLHSFYQEQDLKLPEAYFLKRQAARLSTEFVLLMGDLYWHHLPPNSLNSMLQAEEINVYYHQTQKYLKELKAWQLWPLGFFYTAASHILKKKHALACAEKEKASFFRESEFLASDLQIEVA